MTIYNVPTEPHWETHEGCFGLGMVRVWHWGYIMKRCKCGKTFVIARENADRYNKCSKCGPG